MAHDGAVALEEVSPQDALSMHAHMIDFKKRGTFIRLQWRKAIGKRVPDYGYHPTSIPLARKLVELVIVALFGICRTRVCRRLLAFVPPRLIGPPFEALRRVWKRASKSVKRTGLSDIGFEIS
jgi:coenzyme F420 hydrogenase subunit beta